jgi:hypothetical protein
LPTAKAKPVPKQRLTTKSRRSSNFVTFALALLFLGLFLTAAGWFFREPLHQLGQRFMPGLFIGEESAPLEVNNPAALPTDDATVAENPPANPEPAPKAKANASEDPVVATASASRSSTFDPSAAATPAPATPSPDQAAAKPPAIELVKPEGLDPKPNSTGLMEVPSKPVMAGVSRAGQDSPSAMLNADVKIEVTPEAKPAADALLNFLNASSVRERLRFTLLFG